MRVCGKNVFNELDYKKVRKIFLANNFKDEHIIKTIKENNLKYVLTEPKLMDKMLKNNQGIIGDILDYEFKTLDEIKDDNLVLMLDHLEDPHNFGAIIRSCEAEESKILSSLKTAQF